MPESIAGMVEHPPYAACRVESEIIVDGETTTAEAFDSRTWVRRDGRSQK